jgi:RNA polymerase sigma-70 factor (ECF subfamily)
MNALIATTDALSSDYKPATQRAASAGRNEGQDRRLSSLMRKAQDGDQTAYATLLREVLPILKRVMQARLGFLPASDREDLVQEVLLSLHAARATYDPARPFMPWLMTIAHNRMVDQARRNGRRAANEVLVDEYPADVADQDSRVAADHYGDPEQLRQAIRALPKGQRAAIELLKLREMSLKEASQATGMSIGALKVSVHRAVKALRSSLQG